MESLKSLLKEKKRSGMYWLDSHTSPAELEKQAKAAGLAFFLIEGQKFHKKEQFLNHAALAMHFPEYFGDNWDAFEDCLTDLSWVDADGYVILYEHADAFAEHSPSQFETVLEIFRDAVEFWHNQGKPMLILLRGKRPPPGLEKLA